MKRIVGALCLVSVLLMGSIYAAETVVKKPVKQTSAQAQPKSPKSQEKTKWICAIGLEGEGNFIEEFATRKDCKKYCKGVATVCEETGAKTSVNEEEVD